MSPHRLNALGIGQLVLWGALFYAFVPLAGPLERELGAPAASLSNLLTVALLVSAAASIPVGAAIERFGARRVLTLGAAAGALVLVTASFAGSLFSLGLAFVALGGVYAATLYEPVFALLSVELRGAEARARALRHVTLWGGLASLVFVPFTGWLAEKAGPRTTLLLLGLLVALVAIPIHASLPARRGPSRSPSAAPPPSLPLARVARIAGAFAAASFAATGAAIHGMGLLTEQGYAAPTAALVVGLTGGMQLLGRFFYPWTAQRLGARGLAALGLALQAAGLVLVTAGPATTALFVLLFGTGAGVLTVVRPAVVEGAFGLQRFVRASALVAASTQLARAVAPALVGRMQVQFGYAWAFVALGACSLAALVLLSPARGSGGLRGEQRDAGGCSGVP